VPVSAVLTLPMSVLTARDFSLSTLALPPPVTSRSWTAPIEAATVKRPIPSTTVSGKPMLRAMKSFNAFFVNSRANRYQFGGIKSLQPKFCRLLGATDSFGDSMRGRRYIASIAARLFQHHRPNSEVRLVSRRDKIGQELADRVFLLQLKQGVKHRKSSSKTFVYKTYCKL
jgi:hypothetical protein